MTEASNSSRWWRHLSLGEASVSWGWIAAIGVGLVLGLVVQIIVVSLLDGLGLFELEGAFGLIITQAITVGGVLPILIYLSLRQGSIRRSLLLFRLKLQDVWLALKGVAVYLPLGLGALVVVGVFVPDMLEVNQELGVEAGVVGFELVLAFLALVIITPIVEEIIYRGFIFRGIARSTNIWAGVVVSSLIFGAVHGQLALAADTFAMGTVCAVVVARSGSLWPAIIIHTLKNGLAFFLLFIQPLL